MTSIARNALERADPDETGRRLAIVGSFGGAHTGGSLFRAAAQLGIETVCFDVGNAYAGRRLLDATSWHLFGRRPWRLHRYAAEVVAQCTSEPPALLIATGAAPLTSDALRRLRALGIVCVNYSTDDPWNARTCSRWHQRALPEYDRVFTTRRANLDDFRRLGCHRVDYLPFGYDDALFFPEAASAAAGPDVLFVGGADVDRIAFIADYSRVGGPPIALAGGYWEGFAAPGCRVIGPKSPDEVRALTATAKVNLCLVRRANRDGHVMRSFEIAAIGGCMLVEDTEEHRDIFGGDGECVVYFRTPEDAARRASELIADPEGRARLAAAVRVRVGRGENTYRDRLMELIEAGGGGPAKIGSTRSGVRV